MTLIARKSERGKFPLQFFLWQKALHSCIVYNTKLPTFIFSFGLVFFHGFFFFNFVFNFSRICELVQEC